MGDEQRTPGDERVDVIDDDDRVVGTVSRATMRAERLLHRSVSIAVVSSDDRVLVHRRAEHKDIWPSRWDLAAGGVVAAGESYDVAARRELTEELGIDVDPMFLGEGVYRDAEVALRCRCYVARCDGPFSFTDGEVAEVRWVTLAELEELLTGGVAFVPDSVAITLPLVRRLLIVTD